MYLSQGSRSAHFVDRSDKFWLLSNMLSSLALVVVIVIDQLRTDQLLRIQNQLNPAGLGLLVNKGVFYDDAHHSNFFNMTCPGHVAISTGAFSGLNGIVINDDWDKNSGRAVYCVADKDNHWIDAEADKDDFEMGTSAKRIMTTTVGDELKVLNGEKSKVISVSLKDRAAIGLAGHAGDGAYWYAPKTEVWTTSTAYRPSKTLPSWLQKFNAAFSKHERNADYELTPQSVEDTTDVALAAAEGEKLGHHAKPDILWVSYSTHDRVAHEKSDDSPEFASVFRTEDKSISRLLGKLRRSVSEKILVVLTADHGSGMGTQTAKKLNLPAGKLNEKDTRRQLNECMAHKGFDPKGGAVAAVLSMNVYLADTVKDKRLAREKAKECLNEMEHSVWQAFTREDILSGRIPNAPWLKNLAASYYPARGADVVGVLLPYWNSHGSSELSHETPYDYDSWVPLALWWPNAHKKMIHRRVEVLSLAPTLTRLLNARRPSGATAEFLTEVLDALKP